MKAIYPGSFDPFTNGHLHVLKQACDIFEHVYLIIAYNSNKQKRIDVSKMAGAIKETLVQEGLSDKAEVIVFEGIIAQAAKELNVKYIIKGLRNESDFQYEKNIELINRKFYGIETIYTGAGDFEHVSSSVVMELFKYGEDVSNLVPKPVYDILRIKL
jgi:pantetheine-phosphate adenylyltransferase